MKRQSGVAIITVLLMIALATIAAVSMTKRQYLDVRRQGARQAIAQAKQALLAAEDLAKVVLRLDDAKIDSPDEDWTKSVSAPIAGGLITGCLVDMQGRFNLNNLIDQQGKPDTTQIQRFKLLLNALGIDEDAADSIVAGAIDWIDKDINTHNSNGAEDDYYMSQTNEGSLPYRAANRPFASLSELRMVNGIRELEADTLAKLIRNVSVLPEHTNFNVNTASAESLQMLAAHVDSEKAESLLQWPGGSPDKYPACSDIATGDEIVSDKEVQAPFEKMGDLKAAIKDKNNQLTNDKGIGFSSEYFELRVDAKLGTVWLTQFTLLHRNSKGKVRVVRRSRGEY